MGAPTEAAHGRVGRFTYACRVLCATLVAWPLLYTLTVDDGNAYLFLILVLVATAAGLVVVANSIFCLIRCRSLRSAATNLAFVLLGSAGFVIAWQWLPMFAMH